jgi:hypothetical protein
VYFASVMVRFKPTATRKPPSCGKILLLAEERPTQSPDYAVGVTLLNISVVAATLAQALPSFSPVM